MAHNLARWTARIGLGEQVVTTKTLRRRFFSLAGRLTRSARRLTLHLPTALALGSPVQPGPGTAASGSTPSLKARLQLPQRHRKLAPPRSAGVPCCVFSRHAAHRSSRRRPQGPCPATEDRPPTSNLSQWNPGHLPCSSLSSPSAVLTPSSRVLRWIRA